MLTALQDAMLQNGGTISTKQVLSLGISKTSLTNYVRSGEIERVEPGVYILPDTLEDDMYMLALHSSKITFSHETALFLNNLSDRTPFIHSVTIPSNSSLSSQLRQQCRCFYINAKLIDLGKEVRKTTFGHDVPCYNAERTICDLLRSQNHYSIELITDALKKYAESTGKNLNILSEYAERLHVQKRLRPYMEVLL